MKLAHLVALNFILLCCVATSSAHTLVGSVEAYGSGYCPLPDATLKEFSSDHGYVPGVVMRAKRHLHVDSNLDGLPDSACGADGRVSMAYDTLMAGTTTKLQSPTLFLSVGGAGTRSSANAFDELLVDTTELPPRATARVALIRVVDWQFKGLRNFNDGDTYLTSQASLMLESGTSADTAGSYTVFCSGTEQAGCDLLDPTRSGTKTIVHKLALPRSDTPQSIRIYTSLSTRSDLAQGGGAVAGSLTTAGLYTSLPTAKVYLKVLTPGVKVSSSSGMVYGCPPTVPACQ